MELLFQSLVVGIPTLQAGNLVICVSNTVFSSPGGAQHATQPNFAERGNRNARNSEITKSTMPNRNLPGNLSVRKSTTERCNYIYDSPDNAGYPVYDSTVCVSLLERSASTRGSASLFQGVYLYSYRHRCWNGQLQQGLCVSVSGFGVYPYRYMHRCWNGQLQQGTRGKR